jgi:hypothetical protein
MLAACELTTFYALGELAHVGDVAVEHVHYTICPAHGVLAGSPAGACLCHGATHHRVRNELANTRPGREGGPS